MFEISSVNPISCLVEVWGKLYWTSKTANYNYISELLNKYKLKVTYVVYYSYYNNMPKCLIMTSDSDEDTDGDSEDIMSYYNTYDNLTINSINSQFKSKTGEWCKGYKNIKISGEIKTKKNYYAFTIFDITDNGESFKCKYMGNGAELTSKTVYDMYGSIELGKYGLEFVVEHFVEQREIITKLENLKEEATRNGYFCNKRDIDYDNLNNITILSKRGTQGYSDFIEHLQLPFKINLISVCLEGEGTKPDILKALNKIPETSDLVIIMRGGGMTTDISLSFDYIEIFKAIRACRVPVMTAIGHTNDCKDSLLITEVSDINCHTPTTAATYLNNKCSRIFHKLYKTYSNKYNNILSELSTSTKQQFTKCIIEEYDGLVERLSSVKKVYNMKLLPSELVNIPHSNNHIYVRRGDEIVKYKLTAISNLELDVNILDKVSDITLTSKVNDISDLLKQHEEEFLEVRNIIERNIQLTQYKSIYASATLKDSSIELLDMTNPSKVYKVLLNNNRQLKYYKNKLDNFKSDISEYDLDYNSYKKARLEVEIDITTSTKIFKLLNSLKPFML